MSEIRIKLPSQLDMGALPGLKEELLGALAATSGVTVEGADVERVGTPALQLLLAAARDVLQGGRAFTLHAPSEALMLAFDDLGLGAQAREWSAA